MTTNTAAEVLRQARDALVAMIGDSQFKNLQGDAAWHIKAMPTNAALDKAAAALAAIDALPDAQHSAPSVEPAAFDAEGFRAWVARNLPDDTIIGRSAWWADHLTAWAQRFARRAPAAQAAPADTQAQGINAEFSGRR